MIQRIPEGEFDNARVQYRVNFAVTYVIKPTTEKTVVEFGTISLQGYLVLGGTLLVAIGIAPVFYFQLKASVLESLTALIGMLLGYGVMLFVRKCRPRVMFEVASKTCVICRDHERYRIDGIESVVVINSYHSRPGQESTEGISELLLRDVTGNQRFLYPLVRESGYGSLNDLALRMAKGADVGAEIVDRP